MAHPRLQILVFCLLIVFSQAAGSVLLVLNSSVVDAKFIGSNRLESLELTFNPPTATTTASTTFRLTAFSSTAPGNAKAFNFTTAGVWSYVTGTQNTLSCSVVYESVSNSYGLLQYLADQQSFTMLAAVPLSQFTTDPVTPADVKAAFFPRENCEGGYFSGTLYRLAGTTVTPVSTPAGWTMLSSPESLRFGVANNVLYRYNPMDGTFTSLYTFPSNAGYDIRSAANNRLLVVAANTTATASSTTFNQRMYLFQATAAGFSLITQFAFTAFVPTTTVPPVYPFLASPLLTKLGAIFTAPSNATSTILIKSIDPTNNTVIDLTFQEPLRFLTTINSVAADAPKSFGDSFFVVRNDSATPIANTSFVEETYQFLGNQVLFLRNRVLTVNDTTGFANTYIDPLTPNRLIVLDTYNTASGLAIEQFAYGSILAVTNATIAPNANFAPPPPITSSLLVGLPNSIVDGKFIGSNRLQSLKITLNAPTAANPSLTTTFTLTSYNKTAAGYSNAYTVTTPGSWSYVTGTQNTLSCSVVYESVSNSYGLLQYLADQQSFTMLAAVPLSQFTADPVTPADVKAAFFPRENCEGGYFSGTLYRLAGTTVTPVSTPAGWTMLSSPESLRFGVANNLLYRYNPMDGTFTSLYTFPSNAGYDIRSAANNRLLVVAANTSATASSTTFNQRMYLFQATAANVSLITQFAFTAFVPTTTVPSVYPFLASPLLTKLGAVFNTLGSTTPTILIKSIDPTTNAVSDLTFQEPYRFLNTINALAADAPKFFGDSFFVVRNDSATPIINTAFVEEAYQFMGNQVIFLRNRVLTVNDTTGFVSTYIDPTTPNQLVVLNTYNVANGLNIQQFIYGSIATVNRVLPPTPPAFISYPLPLGTFFKPTAPLPTSPLSWIYTIPTAGNTNITIFQSSPGFPNNIQINSNVLTGALSVLNMNSNCIVTQNTVNNNFAIASPPAPPANSSNSSAPFVVQDITSLLAGITITGATKWGLSDRCDRFSVDNMVFFRAPNQSAYQAIPSFNPSALSRNLDAAVVGNTIWLLSTSGSSFVQAFSSTTPFLLNPSIYRNDVRVVVTSTNSTAAQVKAFFIESTGAFTNCLDYTFAAFQSSPTIQVSSKLSKILAMGSFIPPTLSQVQPRFDFFFVTYANRTALPLNFPYEKVLNIASNFVLLDDQFIYIRSTVYTPANASNTGNPLGSQESVYFISKDVTPLLASSVSLTQAQITAWVRTSFVLIDDGKLNVLIQSQQTINTTNFVVVANQQIFGQQASLNSDSSQGVTGVVDSSGKIKLCAGGCADCTTGTCTSCSRGYFLDTTISQCLPCGSNCATCSSSIYPSCTSCLSNSYLTVNSTCIRCDRSCVTCSGTATTCTSCRPGVTLTAGQCNATCPKNCVTCNGTTCLTCISGFVIANGSCRGCVYSCSNCSATNITQCTSCAPGLTLVNSACVPCPDKCRTCSSGVCATCIPGYSPNANGVCILACQISCATCADNQPSVCLSCYSGAYLSGSSCVLNTTCNNDLSCTDCGQGLSYYLVGSQCIQFNLSNCAQLNTASTTQQCTKCFNGFYLDTNYLCQTCPSTCLTCSSSDICTGCVVGYTLAQNQTEGQCIACQSPCASCYGVSTYCLSCVDGYKKNGWKCQSKKYVSFKLLIINKQPVDVLSTIDTLLQLLATACRNDDTSDITFSSIISGSTSVSGTSTTSDPATSSASLSTTASTGSIGGYALGSVSITTNGVDSQQSKANTGMIVGLAIGITAFVVIMVIVIYVIYRKKQGQNKVVSSQVAPNEAMPVFKTQTGGLSVASDKDIRESGGFPEITVMEKTLDNLNE